MPNYTPIRDVLVHLEQQPGGFGGVTMHANSDATFSGAGIVN